MSVIDPVFELAPPFIVFRKDNKRCKKGTLGLNFERCLLQASENANSVSNVGIGVT